MAAARTVWIVVEPGHRTPDLTHDRDKDRHSVGACGGWPRCDDRGTRGRGRPLVRVRTSWPAGPARVRRRRPAKAQVGVASATAPSRSPASRTAEGLISPNGERSITQPVVPFGDAGRRRSAAFAVDLALLGAAAPTATGVFAFLGLTIVSGPRNHRPPARVDHDGRAAGAGERRTKSASGSSDVALNRAAQRPRPHAGSQPFSTSRSLASSAEVEHRARARRIRVADPHQQQLEICLISSRCSLWNTITSSMR